MPSLLFSKAIPHGKRLRLSLLILLFPVFLSAQTLTGLWTGALRNDSNTVRKDQSFEIALTEYNGKVYGYSRSEFIVDDTLYYILKRVKGTIEGDICEVKDDEIISYNFRGKLDKGIRVTSTFRRNKNDSTWYLDGNWKTNATKKYYSITGKVNLSNEKDLSVSKIFPHLEELSLAGDIAFYREEKDNQVAKIRVAKPERLQNHFSVNRDALTHNNDGIAVSAQPVAPVITEAPVVSIPSVKKQDDVHEKTVLSNIPDASVSNTVIPKNSPVVAANTDKPTVKTVDAMTATAAAEDPAKKTSPPSAGTKTVIADQPGSRTITTTDDITTSNIAQTKPVVSENEDGTLMVNKNNNETVNRAPQGVSGQTTRDNTPVGTLTASNKKEIRQQPMAASTPVQQNTPAGKLTTQSIDNTKQVTVATTTQQPQTTAAVKRADQTIVADAAAKSPASVSAAEKVPVADITAKAATIAGRKSEFNQVVNFKSDSLIISLYDNGEIDGDTVSVFLNGEVLLSRQGLKSSAIKKTIYITPGQQEDFTLVMFAESLGKLPPNTGLLVIRDGDDVYNLRFSSDFQKNAGVVFRKKK